MAKMANFQRKFKMADSRHFENGFSAYLSRRSSDFDEIWYVHVNFDFNNSRVTKNQNFTNRRWRRTAS